MIDIKLIKDEPDRIRAEVAARGLDLGVDRIVELDTQRRELQARFDQARAEQKKAKDAASGKQLKEQVKKTEEELKTVQADFDQLYLQVPNFHHESVPVGKDESENKVAKTIGQKRIPDQARDDGWVRPHYEIPAIKPLIDFERGAKVSGSRFWFLKGELVHLEFALIRYALDFYAAKGFMPMRPPTLVNEAAMIGTGFFPADANEIYDVADKVTDVIEDVGGDIPVGRFLYLSGTAEVPLASYHAGETLEELPVKYVGFAPAYRREAGSYGKDTKGIIRGHEFDKLELFIFSHPDQSWETHEELQAHAEEFWTSLGIPFQVVDICTGDLGAPNAKKYDIEAWLPGEGKYREVGSNSNDTDFQARRLKIKHDGVLVHTLNNTACAVGRAIVAIAENYQDKDGNVDMPEVLHKYLPFTKISAKS